MSTQRPCRATRRVLLSLALTRATVAAVHCEPPAGVGRPSSVMPQRRMRPKVGHAATDPMPGHCHFPTPRVRYFPKGDLVGGNAGRIVLIWSFRRSVVRAIAWRCKKLSII